MDTRKKYSAFLKAALATMFWGASFVAMKMAVREATPPMMVWVRSLMGVAVLFISLIVGKHSKFSQSFRDIVYMALLGFMGVTFHNLIQAEALKTAQAATSAWIVSTTPIIIALLGWAFLKEEMTKERVAGILSAAWGVLMVLGKGGSLVPQGITKGDLLISLSAVNWAAFTVISRKFLGDKDQTVSLFYVMLFGWIFSNAFVLPSGIYFAMSRQAWISLVFLGIFCSGIAYIFWYDALHVLPASQVGVFMYLNPLTATATAVIFLKETLSFKDIIGAMLVILGLWLVNKKKP